MQVPPYRSYQLPVKSATYGNRSLVIRFNVAFALLQLRLFWNAKIRLTLMLC
jgi:hypothetical protein